MKNALSTVRDAVRSQLWPLPAAAVLVAVAAGVLTPRLDAALDQGLPSWISALVFGGDAGAARTVLDAVSSSLITVTSLTFSLTVVTLQLASSQFSPRLLRTFTRDIFVQATLAVFLATFVFSLTVLRAVRSEAEGRAAFVPRLSVTTAYVLAVVSVLALVFFLAHLAKQIRVETMLQKVHDEALATIRSVLEVRDGPPQVDVVLPEVTSCPLVAGGPGFLTRIDEQQLLQVAVAAGAVIDLRAHPGAFLVAAVPIGTTWRLDGALLTDDELDSIVADVRAAVRTGFERTAGQDVGFGLRQLTDVANKALSPGINDPTTAVHALGHVSAVLCELADRDLGARQLRHKGVVRVVLRRPDFREVLETTLTQPRRYGAADPQVQARLYTVLSDLAVRVPADLRSVVRGELDRLRRTTTAQDFDATTDELLTSLGRSVEQSLMSTPQGTAGRKRD